MTIFKRKHLYGQVLTYLYENAEKEIQFIDIIDKINAMEEDTERQLYYLIKDELVVKEIEKRSGTNIKTQEHGDFDFLSYRISHKGFQFIRQLETAKLNKKLGLWSLSLSIISIIVATARYFI
jgi:hypothetical protein